MRGWLRNPISRNQPAAPVPQGTVGNPQPWERDRLVCYGCVHCAVGIPFPSGPSGERPCGFCIRNAFLDPLTTHANRSWYDGSEPISVPMDAYYTLDMRDQMIEWIKAASAVSPEERQETIERLLALREAVSH